jgi:RNA polymerase sigma factor (sigma-70 family)
VRRTIEQGELMHEDFRALFDDQAARVVRLAALLGAEDPEDAAQEAFCRLYEKRGDLQRPLAQAGPYLNRIVVNIVRDRHRRLTTQRRLRLLSRRDDERHAPSPEELSVLTDESRRVVSALVAIAPRRREAVVLRYWLDLPYSEIAQAMGVSLGAAKSAVSRGLDDLHTHLEDS